MNYQGGLFTKSIIKITEMYFFNHCTVFAIQHAYAYENILT